MSELCSVWRSVFDACYACLWICLSASMRAVTISNLAAGKMASFCPLVYLCNQSAPVYNLSPIYLLWPIFDSPSLIYLRFICCGDAFAKRSLWETQTVRLTHGPREIDCGRPIVWAIKESKNQRVNPSIHPSINQSIDATTACWIPFLLGQPWRKHRGPMRLMMLVDSLTE